MNSPTQRLSIGLCVGLHFYEGFSVLCHRIRVDPVDHCPDAQPEGEVCEHLHHTALAGKRRTLKDRRVFHQSIVEDVLHDMVDKIDLTAVQAGVVEVVRKSLFCRIHIQVLDVLDKPISTGRILRPLARSLCAGSSSGGG